MKILHNLMRNKCDVAGCSNIAEYSVVSGELNSKNDIHFCSHCLNQLNIELSKFFTPKSIKSKFNKNADTEIKKIFEKGEK